MPEIPGRALLGAGRAALVALALLPLTTAIAASIRCTVHCPLPTCPLWHCVNLPSLPPLPPLPLLPRKKTSQLFLPSFISSDLPSPMLNSIQTRIACPAQPRPAPSHRRPGPSLPAAHHRTIAGTRHRFSDSIKMRANTPPPGRPDSSNPARGDRQRPWGILGRGRGCCIQAGNGICSGSWGAV